VTSHELSTAEGLIRFIQESPKSTPVKAYVQGRITVIPESVRAVKIFHRDHDPLLIGEHDQVTALIAENAGTIQDLHIEHDRRNSAVPLLDLREIDARVEPGAVIRDRVHIGSGCIIMMGAMINIGASIGDRTMIDMNTVIGGRALVGANCHIGAGAVVAGVIEPPSARPVTIGDNVLVGANAVIIEGVTVGEGAVVAAGAVVGEDVEPLTVVAGTPARVIKHVDAGTQDKTKIVDALRESPDQ